MTMPHPIQTEQPWREFKDYSGNFLNIRFTARTWPLVTSICFGPLKHHLGGKCFADDEEVETKVWKLLRQVKRLLCCGFRRTGNAMGQVYQCWWRICREINV
jgi:hypothetical protein